MPHDEPQIRCGQSCASDAEQAVAEFREQIWQPDLKLVVFFCASTYDTERLAGAILRAFPGIPTVGCTTAGEIGPAGYRRGSLTGAGLAGEHFRAATGCLESLQSFEFSRAQRLAHDLELRVGSNDGQGNGGYSFGLLMVDGLSTREEAVTHALHASLRGIPLVGGSAADDLHFSGTLVYHDGRFHRDAAVVALVRTDFPVRTFKSQHFVYRDERLVVTDADAQRRVVYELNGFPAAAEYARLIGTTPEQLTPQCFAASPVIVLIDGTDYVRSIQKANPDGSLTFYCAIENGLVLRVASGVDLLDELARTLAELRGEIGELQAVFAFDCVLRNLEMEQKGQKTAAAEQFRRHHVVGFATYGEQYGGVHVNQTLTGVAIGRLPGSVRG